MCSSVKSSVEGYCKLSIYCGRGESKEEPTCIDSSSETLKGTAGSQPSERTKAIVTASREDKEDTIVKTKLRCEVDGVLRGIYESNKTDQSNAHYYKRK
jgi:hypothetical protein